MKTQASNPIEAVTVLIRHHEAMGEREILTAATLHELEHEMLSSFDAEKTARILLHAQEMYEMLKKAVHPCKYVSTKEMRALLYRIETKEVE